MSPTAALVVGAAGPSLIDLGEGAPWWAKLLAGVLSLAAIAAPFVLPKVLTGKTPPDQQARNPSPTTPLEGGRTVTAQPTATAEPDPEIALIAETLRGYRDELRDVRAQMVEAEDRHRRELAEAEARHQRAMADVRATLEQSERTRLRLEAMVDVMTGRRPPPDQPPGQPPGPPPPGPPGPPGPRHQGL